MASKITRVSKGQFTPLFDKWKLFPSASPEKYGGSYLKNAMSEIPEVLFGIPYLLIGVFGLAYYIKRSQTEIEPPFKPYYHVIRSDDKRVKFVDLELVAKYRNLTSNQA